MRGFSLRCTELRCFAAKISQTVETTVKKPFGAKWRTRSTLREPVSSGDFSDFIVGESIFTQHRRHFIESTFCRQFTPLTLTLLPVAAFVSTFRVWAPGTFKIASAIRACAPWLWNLCFSSVTHCRVSPDTFCDGE